MVIQKKVCILVTAICLAILSLPSYARAGGAGAGYGNRGATGSPAGAACVPAGANANGAANRAGTRR